MGDFTLSAEATYNVIVRILPSGKEVELELPATSTGKIIKDSLLDHSELAIPRIDPEGNRITYKLSSKRMGKEVADDKTLYEAGISDGDTLLMAPIIVAGHKFVK